MNGPLKNVRAVDDAKNDALRLISRVLIWRYCVFRSSERARKWTGPFGRSAVAEIAVSIM